MGVTSTAAGNGRCEGVGYSEPLCDCIEASGFRSRHSNLPPDPKAFITETFTNLLGGTEIDHALHNSPTMVLSQYDSGACGPWLGMSDHQPVVAACSGPKVSPMPHPRLQSGALPLAQSLSSDSTTIWSPSTEGLGLACFWTSGGSTPAS